MRFKALKNFCVTVGLTTLATTVVLGQAAQGRQEAPPTLDQLRTVDSERLVKRLGRLSAAATTEVLDTLQEMFAE